MLLFLFKYEQLFIISFLGDCSVLVLDLGNHLFSRGVLWIIVLLEEIHGKGSQVLI